MFGFRSPSQKTLLRARPGSQCHEAVLPQIRAEMKAHLEAAVDIPLAYLSPINSNDYPELVSKDAPVKTVAVGTVLLAYNWPTKSERYQRVNRFVHAFLSHLNEIKARRPKWQDFDISSSVSGWTRFPAAEQWLKKAGLIPEPDKATAQEQVPLDPKQREALFREFADYQRIPQPAQAALLLDPTRREALFRDFAEYRKHQQTIIAYHETTVDH